MEDLLSIVINVLNVITIVICFILKIPQIWNIITLKSSQGLSTLGVTLELICYTVMTCYSFLNNYPLISYLEYPVILCQQLVVVYLVLLYSNKITRTTISMGISYFILSACLFLQILPKSVVIFAAPLCLPVAVTSKVVQLLTIVRSKNAESVSLTSWFISALTNMTRIVTTYLSSGDKMLIVNFTTSATLSSSVMFTAMYYKNRPKQE